MSEPTIEDYYIENRTFPPSQQFQENALVADRSLYEEAEVDRLAFLGSTSTRISYLV